MIYLTRRERFSSAHRMFRPGLSDEENMKDLRQMLQPSVARTQLCAEGDGEGRDGSSDGILHECDEAEGDNDREGG